MSNRYPRGRLTHPLINPDSAHYDRGKYSAIETLEYLATVLEQIGWCKGNIFKYNYRVGHKGTPEQDMKKKETFEAYLALLESLPAGVANMKVVNAYDALGIEMVYRPD